MAVVPRRAWPTVSDIAKRALRRAGVTVPRPGAHVFRHTVASQMVRRDVPMKTVADLLGPLICRYGGRAVTKNTSGGLVGGRERNAATRAAPTSAGNGSSRSRPPLPATRTAPLCQSTSFTVRAAASAARRPSRLRSSRMARSRRPPGRVSSTAVNTRCTSSSARARGSLACFHSRMAGVKAQHRGGAALTSADSPAENGRG